MVVRVNGSPQQGLWFEQDVRILQITTDASDWIEQAGVDGGTEQVLELIAERCTILGVTFGSADDLWVLCGYANAYTVGNTHATSGSVEDLLGQAIDAISSPAYANTTVAVFAGFGGIVPDTTP